MKSLIAKLLPLDRIIAIASRLGFLSKPMSILAEAWAKGQGYRSQVCIAAAGALAVAAYLGFIRWEAADPVIQSLLGLASAALLDKWNRIAPTVKDLSEKSAKP